MYIKKYNVLLSVWKKKRKNYFNFLNFRARPKPKPIFPTAAGGPPKTKSMFGSVVAGAFQITFRAKMHVNDFFLFFKNYF